MEVPKTCLPLYQDIRKLRILQHCLHFFKPHIIMTKTVFSLATFDSPTITGIRELTIDEFEKISQEINDLESFHSEDALYNLIKLNYNDLEARVEFYLNQYISNPRLDFSEFSSQFLDINRLILNLLSSIRTYLDHTETRLKRTFGEKSEEFLQFKTLTSDCFDNHFSYRFLTKLRNYSQHCGLPTGSISISEDENGHSLKLSLVRDSLLKNYDSWGAIVKPQLQAQNEEFDIIPLLKNKTSLLKEVNQKISLSQIKKLSTQGNHLLELIIETQDKGQGIPCILKMSGHIDNPTMQIKWFPYDIISKITGTKINAIYTGE